MNAAGFTRRKLVPVLAICLIAGVGSYFVFKSSASVDGKYDINKIAVQLGPEEYVAGPTDAHDTTYFTERDDKGRWYGFTGNGTSFVIPLNEKNMLPESPLQRDKKDIPKHRVILDADTAAPRNVDDPKHPDTCGAWIIGAVYKNPKKSGHWIGWYHGERNCLRGNLTGGDRTHMTMGYAESFDSGKTWKKTGYPNNRIITADRALENNGALNDTGNGRVIQIGDYFYMFYQSNSAQEATATGRKIHIARSKVSDLGRPGTWKKWYCTDINKKSTCSFNQPGVGGKSTRLANEDGKNVLKDQYVTWNRYLNRYIAFGNEKGSFRLLASEGDDFLNWTSKQELIQPIPTSMDDFTVDNWNKDATPAKCYNKDRTKVAECKQLYGYNSIIGMQGNSDGSGKNFYIYYLKHYAGQGFGDGYILRRKVTLQGGTATTMTARTELALYKDAKGRQRITSELPEPWLGYVRKSTIGYVLSNPAPGYQPLFECKKPDGSYYAKRIKTTEPYGVPVPGDPPTKCSATDKLIRRIGWVSPVRTSEATEAIYDVSGSSALTQRGAPLGYILKGL